MIPINYYWDQFGRLNEVDCDTGVFFIIKHNFILDRSESAISTLNYEMFKGKIVTITCKSFFVRYHRYFNDKFNTIKSRNLKYYLILHFIFPFKCLFDFPIT